MTTHRRPARLVQPSNQEDLFGQRLVQRLSQATDQLPHDISERLRVARLQALSQLQAAPALVLQPAGAATLQNAGHGGLWARWVSLVPLLALAVSLFAVNMIISDERDLELAEIDTALLTDDLPPHAYTDPGFVQFLKMPLMERTSPHD